MIPNTFIPYLLYFLLSIPIFGQSTVIGTWKTVDDHTGEARSIVRVYQENGLVYGKIIEVLKEEEKGQLCKACEGVDYNKPIEGMMIIKNMKQEDDYYENGTIMDPENGKIYRCKIWVDSDKPDILNVRGYIAFLYRTQQWIRVQ